MHFSQTDKGTGQKDHSHITKLDVKYKKNEDEHDDDDIQTNLLNAHLWIIKIWE